MIQAQSGANMTFNNVKAATSARASPSTTASARLHARLRRQHRLEPHLHDLHRHLAGAELHLPRYLAARAPVRLPDRLSFPAPRSAPARRRPSPSRTEAPGGPGQLGAATGDFSQTNNCGSTLAAGATCTVNVTFTPTADGHPHRHAHPHRQRLTDAPCRCPHRRGARPAPDRQPSAPGLRRTRGGTPAGADRDGHQQRHRAATVSASPPPATSPDQHLRHHPRRRRLLHRQRHLHPDRLGHPYRHPDRPRNANNSPTVGRPVR